MLNILNHNADISLYPVQKFILKCIYGIPLNNTVESIELRTFDGKVVNTVTEEDYLTYLYLMKRSNIKKVIPGNQKNIINLCAGRRGGKSTLGGIISSYEAANFLSKENPHQYYGIHPDNKINILFGGITKDQNWFNRTIFDRFFKGEKKDTQSYSLLGKNLKAEFKSYSPTGLCGSGNYFVYMDEFAYANLQDAENFYQCVTPSMYAYSPKDKNGDVIGPRESKLLNFSSPNGKKNNLFYKLFMSTFGDNRDDTLSLRIPSWEMNPTIPVEFLIKQKDCQFYSEFGAEFI